MAKLKSVNVEKIDRESHPDIYAMADELVTKYHDGLNGCHYVLFWKHNWKPDVNGRVTLGMAKLPGDENRELFEHDFRILLNKEWWDQFDDSQRKALLDHELCHVEWPEDKEGNKKQDDRGRPVLRIRRHDIGEFRVVVSRHGLYKSDLMEFVAAAEQAKRSGIKNTHSGVPVGVD
jgi:hypothetical protein